MSDAEVHAEAAAIHARLAALASRPPDAQVARELGAIRAQLREMAKENAEIGEQLAVTLGLRPAPGSPRHGITDHD